MNSAEENQPDLTATAQTSSVPLRRRPLPDRPVSEQLATLHLEVVGGPMDGVTAHVAKNVITIGRSPKADLSLRLDPMVSTHHARIVREGNNFWLEDLDSRNGTYLGEHRIQERTLIGPGTLFALGSTFLEFSPV